MKIATGTVTRGTIVVEGQPFSEGERVTVLSHDTEPFRVSPEEKRLAEYPDAGAIAEDVELAGVRRVVLLGTQHYVYYRIDAQQKRIEILAVWSTKLGGPPPVQ